MKRHLAKALFTAAALLLLTAMLCLPASAEDLPTITSVEVTAPVFLSGDLEVTVRGDNFEQIEGSGQRGKLEFKLGENNSYIFDIWLTKQPDGTLAGSFTLDADLWMLNDGVYTLSGAISLNGSDAQTFEASIDADSLPKITSVEVTTPSFLNDSVRFTVRGDNFDKIDAAETRFEIRFDDDTTYLVWLTKQPDGSFDGYRNFDPSRWTLDDDVYTLAGTIALSGTEGQPFSISIDASDLPTITSVKVTAPTFLMGNVHFAIRGENFDKISGNWIECMIETENDGTYYLELAKQADGTLAGSRPFWTSAWTLKGNVYTLAGELSLDGFNTHPIYVSLSADSLPKITSAEVTPPAFPGGAVKFRIRGDHFDKIKEEEIFCLFQIGETDNVQQIDMAQEEDGSFAGSCEILTDHWTLKDGSYTLSGSLSLGTDDYPVSMSIDTSSMPKITSAEITPPAFPGGAVKFRIRGDHFDKIADEEITCILRINNDNGTYNIYTYNIYMERMEDGSFVGFCEIWEGNWTLKDGVYTLSGSLSLGGDSAYPFTMSIDASAMPKITSVEVTSPATLAEQITFTLRGENLDKLSEDDLRCTFRHLELGYTPTVWLTREADGSLSGSLSFNPEFWSLANGIYTLSGSLSFGGSDGYPISVSIDASTLPKITSVEVTPPITPSGNVQILIRGENLDKFDSQTRGIFRSNSYNTYNIWLNKNSDGTLSASPSFPPHFWTLKDGVYTLSGSLSLGGEDGYPISISIDASSMPKITSVEITPPVSPAGIVQFLLHGEHFDKIENGGIQSLFKINSNTTYGIYLNKMPDGTLSGSRAFDPEEWTLKDGVYTLSGSLSLGANDYPVTVSFDAASVPSITSVEITPPASLNGRVTFTLRGNNFDKIEGEELQCRCQLSNNNTYTLWLEKQADGSFKGLCGFDADEWTLKDGVYTLSGTLSLSGSDRYAFQITLAADSLPKITSVEPLPPATLTGELSFILRGENLDKIDTEQAWCHLEIQSSSHGYGFQMTKNSDGSITGKRSNMPADEWTLTDENYVLSGTLRLSDFGGTDMPLTFTLAAASLPKITSIEVVAPQSLVGQLQVKLHGQNFDKLEYDRSYAFITFTSGSYPSSNQGFALDIDSASLMTGSYPLNPDLWTVDGDAFVLTGAVHAELEGEEITKDFEYRILASELPTVTSAEAIAPTFRGGAIEFRFHGQNLDKIGQIRVYGNFSDMNEPTVVDPTLITCLGTPSYGYWSVNEEGGYTCSLTVRLELDGTETAYPFTVTISSEEVIPQISNVSYNKTLSSAGGIVDVVLSGKNLAHGLNSVSLTARSSFATIEALDIRMDGENIRMKLPIPALIGDKDVTYKLEVKMGNMYFGYDRYNLTVKAGPADDRPTNVFDLNGDGSVDVMDAIYLIRVITGNVG